MRCTVFQDYGKLKYRMGVFYLHVVIRLLFTFRRESFEFLYGFTSSVVVETVCKQRIWRIQVYILSRKLWNAFECCQIFLWHFFLSFFFFFGDSNVIKFFGSNSKTIYYFDAVPPLRPSFSIFRFPSLIEWPDFCFENVLMFYMTM